jgi:rhodanese-related sulfurtransferase
MIGWRAAIREALALALCASVLGFMYTGIRGKGLFAPDISHSSVSANSAAPTIIHVSEAKELLESGRAIFIDARPPFEYDLGHIPRAVNIPLGDFDSHRGRLDSFPKNKILVTYCDGVECNSSIGLASRLREAGFPAVRIFFAGWNEWQNSNLPVETTKR